MGREWYWTRPFRKVTGGDNGDVEDHHHHQWNNNFNKKTKTKTKTRDLSTTDVDATTQVMGCMSGVFQLFHLQQLLFTTRSNGTTSSRSSGNVDHAGPSSSDAIYHRRNTSFSSASCRGVEAPRNSLELDAATDPNISRIPSISSVDHDIPFCIQVVVGKSKRRETLGEILRDEELVDSSNRNVVAKLMGLETLPSLSSSSRKFAVDDSDVVRSGLNKSKRKVRTPLQPRNWNVMEEEEEDLVVGRYGGTRSLPETPRTSCRRSWDSDPRLSVQENRGGNLSASAMQELKCIFEDHVRSPPAMVKSQNPTTRFAGEIVKQRKNNVVCRRIEKRSSIKDPPETLRVLEQKHFSSPKKKLPVLPPTQHSPEKCEKACCRRFNERMKTPPASIITPSPPRPHPATTTTPRPPIRTCNKNPPPLLQLTSFVIKSDQNLPQVTAEPQLVLPEEFLYLKRVLERAGIRQHTYLPFAVRWNSPSHPLDPIIFHQLELAHTAATVSNSKVLRHRCNRKLLFDLINEILAETLYPYFMSNPRTDFLRPFTASGRKRYFDGGTLLNEIWLKVRNFPESKCEDQHDIDELVEFDLIDSNIHRLFNHPAVEEEVETILVEIEKSIVDFLLLPCLKTPPSF